MAIRLLQFTDLHLFAEPERRITGMDTYASAQAVLELAADRLDDCDAILLTGDLVHDGSAAGYDRLFQLFQPIDKPVYAIPGNHDLPGQLHAALERFGHATADAVTLGAWRLIQLDSFIAQDEEAGELGEAQLERLESLLHATPDALHLLALHHPPVSIDSAWIDAIGLRDADALAQIAISAGNVHGMVCGHVHQAHERRLGDIPVFTTPSTCVQFTPFEREFTLDTAAPAFRWLSLHDDGRIDTDIVRLARMPESFSPDLPYEGHVG